MEKTDLGDVTTRVQTNSVCDLWTVSDAPDRAEAVLTPRVRTALEQPE